MSGQVLLTPPSQVTLVLHKWWCSHREGGCAEAPWLSAWLGAHMLSGYAGPRLCAQADGNPGATWGQIDPTDHT